MLSSNRCRAASALLGLLVMAGAAGAAEVGLFRLDSRDEIVAGETDGTAIGPLGQIELGFATEKLKAFEEPFLLSAAAAPGGGFLIGTGNDGKVFAVGAGGGSELLAQLPEGQVFSLLVRRDGSRLAAASPQAKVYRLGAKGPEVLFDPAATYVWAMAEDAAGRLLVATGLPGRLYRVDAQGKAEVLYEGAEPHLRSLLVLPGGDLLFGSAGQGLLLRRSEAGGEVQLQTLYDAAEPEVAALALAPDGRIFAALLASEASQVDLAAGDAASTADKAAMTGAEPTVVGTRATKATGPRSLVVEIVGREIKKLFELQDETVHGMAFAAGHLWVGTGQDGHLYRYQDEVLVREASFEEKQLVALLPQGEGLAIATTDAAALYRLSGARRSEGSFTSKPLDAKDIAAFGVLRAEGRAGGFAFEARSGATETPDLTWSAWQKLPLEAGQSDSFNLAGVSPARYLQVRAQLKSKSGTTTLPRLDAIELSYRQENRAPRIDKLEVLAPGEILVPAGFNPVTTTFEPWSPDRQGIFTSIKAEEDKGEGRLKSLFKKGYRTLRWTATDGNGDPLRFTLEVQAEGEEGWLTVVEELDDDHFSFDATVLPDGRYRFRLRAHDGAGRSAGAGLSASRSSELVLIDNSPARLLSRRPAGGAAGRLEVELEDASPLREVALSIDGGDWQRLEAADGLLDGRREKLAFSVPPGSRFVVLRVTDAAFNVLTFPIEPR